MAFRSGTRIAAGAPGHGDTGTYVLTLPQTVLR